MGLPHPLRTPHLIAPVLLSNCKLQAVYDEEPEVVEPARVVPHTYRKATPSSTRSALLANVNYKDRGTAGGDDETTKKQPIGTTRNYSRHNEEGSFTFGYEGTFPDSIVFRKAQRSCQNILAVNKRCFGCSQVRMDRSKRRHEEPIVSSEGNTGKTLQKLGSACAEMKTFLLLTQKCLAKETFLDGGREMTSMFPAYTLLFLCANSVKFTRISCHVRQK